MSLSSVSIKRPVLAIVMSLIIIIFGIIGATFLGVREYPSVDPPVITVSTNYTGTNAEVIESQITEPLEESLNSVPGIKTLTSVSRDGRSTITAEFTLDVDLDAAANDIRDKVSSAIDQLPEDADPPEITKADADDEPIVFLNIKSENRSLLELTEMADNIFKERFQTIKGVSRVDIWGDKTYSMRLWMEPEKMASYGITPVDVKQAVDQENIELPTGRIEGEAIELSVRTMGRLETEEQFNNLIVKETDNNQVKFKDIGRAELGPVNQRTILKRDGIPMVGVVLRPQPGANSIAIADEFYKRLEKIKPGLPADLELGIGFDKTDFIRSSINEVEQTLIIAFSLVVLIIFFFLRDWRTTIIPVITIPIALTGTFFIMYAFGFSINVLTLLALVLAIGLVVDDTIVVLENIYKKIESGEKPMDAGLKGAQEIFFAVISTTIALAAVFMPVIFMTGTTGRLFREFGIVVAGAVVISSFVALTLGTMLSSRILKRRAQHNRLYNKTEPFFQGLNIQYDKVLNWFLKNKAWAIIIVVISAGMIYLFIRLIPSELAPTEDRSMVRMFAKGPEGATFEYMDHHMDQLIKLVKDQVPESEAINTVTSPGFGASTSINSGFMRLKLVPPDERKRSQTDIVNALTPDVKKLNMANTFVSEEQSIASSGVGGLPVQFVIQGNTIDQLKEIIPVFMDSVRAHPAFAFSDVNLTFNKPELEVTIDRQKARNIGVNVQDIAQTLQYGLSGIRFGYFTMRGEQYDIIGQVNRTDRNEPMDLKSLYVKNESGKLIQMDNVVQAREQSTPPQLYRYNRYSSATISAALANGHTLGEGIDAMQGIAGKVLDSSFSTALSGPSQEFEESANNLIYAFLFAIILIYLVLSAQFESFRDPLIIMFTVPLALAGALLSLWYFNETLNIFSQIGIIMLVGLVTKNGILIVEFSNQFKAQGHDLRESAIKGASARFRPILMTSLSTILGVLPIALALGSGSESRVSMGIAVIGGMLFATILTLVVIPIVYTFVSSKTHRLARI